MVLSSLRSTKALHLKWLNLTKALHLKWLNLTKALNLKWLNLTKALHLKWLNFPADGITRRGATRTDSYMPNTRVPNICAKKVLSFGCFTPSSLPHGKDRCYAVYLGWMDTATGMIHIYTGI